MQPRSARDQDQAKDTRRIYTSLNEEMPVQMSYQNIKLANFLQLELTDLWDSLLQVNDDNFKNQLKETLSRSYNAFHEMKKLYDDLGMNFLYLQAKKLISSYGVIFVYLLDRLQKYEKSHNKQQEQPQSSTNRVYSNIEQQIRVNIKSLKDKNSNEETRKLKRNRGVHLYNQSYARCIDYDVEYFRQVREKQSEKQRTQEEMMLLKAERDRKFKKEVLEEINDVGSLRVDGEELYSFLSRHRTENQTGVKICLGDELQKIAIFFKESQHQALQFLRKEKNVQNFHELTQGFNVIVSDYESNKASQIFFIQDKIKQIFTYIKNKVQKLEQQLQQKQQTITNLRNFHIQKKTQTKDYQTQTFFNIEEEIKQLHRRIVTAQMINQQLKTYVAKSNDEDRREKIGLVQQINVREASCKQLKDTLDEKVQYIVKIQRRLKIIQLGNKNKNIKNPIQLFNELSEEMKKIFIEELKQQGYINMPKKSSIYSPAKMSKLSGLERRESQTVGNENNQETPMTPTESVYQKNTNLRRQSSFYKKSNQSNQAGGLLSNKDFQNKNVSSPDQHAVRNNTQLTFIKQQENSGSSKLHSENEKQKSRQNSSRDREQMMKSRKVIAIRQFPNEGEIQKLRVFDLQEDNRGVYSQKRLGQQLKQDKQINEQTSLSNKSLGINGEVLMRLNSRKERQMTEETNENQQVKQTSNDQKSKQRTSIQMIKRASRLFQTAQVTQNSLEEQESIDRIKETQSPQKKIKKTKKRQHKRQRSKISSCGQNQQQQQQDQEIDEETYEVINYKQPIGRTSYGRLNPIKYKYKGMGSDVQVGERENEGSNANYYDKFSIVNQVNLAIRSNTFESYSEHKLSDLPNQLKTEYPSTKYLPKQQQQQDKILQRSLTKQNQMDAKSQQQLKMTTRKLNNIQKNEIKDKTEDQRKTRTNLKKDQIISKSLSNTFHRHSKRQSQQHASVANPNRTISNFKNGLFNQHRSVNSEVEKQRGSQGGLGGNGGQIRSLEQEFGEDQIIQASRTCNSPEQFQQKVIKLHESKCGKNCKHLQRFLDIFERIRKQTYRYRRQIKLHVQNLNDKLMMEESVNLPNISKK